MLLTTVQSGPVWMERESDYHEVNNPCRTIHNCDCSINNTIMDCAYRHFGAIPDKIPHDVKILQFAWNQVIHVSDKVFKNLYELIELNLEFNVIVTIDERAFDGLKSLLKLRLTGNQIKYTETFQKTLMPLTYLTILEIQQNLCGFYNDSTKELIPALENMKQLEKLSLDLDENGLSGFTKPLRSIKQLTVYKVEDATYRCQMKILMKSTLIRTVPSATNIALQNCGIEEIESGSFGELKYLEALDLSYNEHLGFKSMSNISMGLNRSSFTNLTLTQIQPRIGDCIRVPTEAIKSIASLSLKHLVLDRNRISSIETEGIDKVHTTLETISVSDNQMILGPYVNFLLGMKVFQNVRVLNASMQGINHFLDSYNHVFKRSVNPHVPRKWSQVDPLLIPPNVETIDFSSSKMDMEIQGGLSVYPTNELRHLYMSNNRFRTLQGSFLGLTKLISIDLSMNSCKQIGSTIFHNVSTLEHLDLSQNFLAFDIEGDHGGIIFSKLGNLQTLDISENQIRKLPKHVFRGLTQLKGLKLSGNRVKQFDIQVNHMKSMKTLLLDKNEVEYLGTKIREDLNKCHDLVVDLSDNELKCNCESIEFLKWLGSPKVKFLSRTDYTCTLPDDHSGNLTKPIQLYYKLKLECINYGPLIGGTILSIVVVCFVIIAAVIYRHRWSLRYMYYSAKFRLKGYIQLHNISDSFEFDAFVCYSDTDKPFLVNKLIPELEEKRGVRLCVHERDFQGGTSVTGNVVRAISSSSKTLLLVSKGFTESGWCKFEMNMARLEGINTGREVLCVIKIEDFPLNNLPLEVLDIMRNQTYVDLPKKNAHMDVFWDRVKTAIFQ